MYTITSLTKPLVIEVPKPGEREMSCVCVLGVLILSLFLQCSDWNLEVLMVSYFLVFYLYQQYILLVCLVDGV